MKLSSGPWPGSLLELISRTMVARTISSVTLLYVHHQLVLLKILPAPTDPSLVLEYEKGPRLSVN